MATYENIVVERADQIATITVNRPRSLNALNSQTLRELTMAVRECADERVIILTGAGDRAFVAGADISEMLPMTPWAAREFSELGHVLTALIEDLPCAAIAAVNGFALGGGLELAVACDLIFVAENAKLGLPEVSLGVTPGFGGTQRLVRLVGKIKAKEMIFTGDMIDARRALEIGLCNAVLPREQLIPHCRQIAEKIALQLVRVHPGILPLFSSGNDAGRHIGAPENRRCGSLRRTSLQDREVRPGPAVDRRRVVA